MKPQATAANGAPSDHALPPEGAQQAAMWVTCLLCLDELGCEPIRAGRCPNRDPFVGDA